MKRPKIVVIMRRTILALIVLGSMLSLLGCAARINNMMRSWEGQHYSDLIARWGPPQQVFDDGSDGRILIYTQVREWTSPGKSTTYTEGRATIYDDYIWGSATSRTTYQPSQTYGCTAHRMFWISKKGYIYRWAWKGL